MTEPLHESIPATGEGAYRTGQRPGFPPRYRDRGCSRRR
jgi:hypothetical protein